MLTLLALYKIRTLLDGNLRLRTACDLKVAVDVIKAETPVDFVLPTEDVLADDLRTAIAACTDRMELTTVTYKK